VADLNDRAGWEARLQAAVAGLMPGQLQRLMAEIRIQSNLNNITIPESLWAEFSSETRVAITPILEQIFIESAREAAAQYPTLAVNWTLVNAQAATWASGYSFDLVKLIDGTTRDGLQQAVSAYFKTAETMGDLRAALAQFVPTIQDTLGRTLYSVNRAGMIATTEVTRAAWQGEQIWKAEIKRDNSRAQFDSIWQTNKDEIVARCPICFYLQDVRKVAGWYVVPKGPRQGQRFRGQPAHPRCRCWEQSEIVNLDEIQA
jgi:hypothetical protein